MLTEAEQQKFALNEQRNSKSIGNFIIKITRRNENNEKYTVEIGFTAVMIN